jgi:hypothetical protein
VKAADRSLNTSINSAQVSAQPTGQPALVAHYTFDGNTGDSSGNANNPIVLDDSPALVSGKYGSALGLNGKSQWPADPMFSGALDEVLVANYAMSAAQVAWLPFNSAPLPTLVHRYNFNEAGGTVVHESVGGSAWNGSLPNGGAFSGGQLALAAARSQYVNLPPDLLSNYNAVTLEAWATFPDQIPWNTMFFSFGNTSGADGHAYIFCAPEGGRIAITPTNYLGEQNAHSAIDFSFHTNLHLTAIFNPPAGYLAIYTNGALAGLNPAIITPMNAVSNVFSFLGSSLYSGDAYFDCSVNEFRIYNGVMQPADIAAAQLVGPNVLLSTNALLIPWQSGGNLTLNWPLASAGLTLESSPSLGVDAVWTPVTTTPAILGTNNQVTLLPTNAVSFFRLRR